MQGKAKIYELKKCVQNDEQYETGLILCVHKSVRNQRYVQQKTSLNSVLKFT